MGLGLLDILSRGYENLGMAAEAREIHQLTGMLQNVLGFIYRPSAAMADEPGTPKPENPVGQMEALWKAFTEFCNLTGYPALSPCHETSMALEVFHDAES
ncbi:hypothetical protein [Streptomyces iranensis]|uniref:hypothetical protein n=1 Tax=Streptomyces iranensis TaxID=576784 RepID=UPI0039B75C62